MCYLQKKKKKKRSNVYIDKVTYRTQKTKENKKTKIKVRVSLQKIRFLVSDCTTNAIVVPNGVDNCSYCVTTVMSYIRWRKNYISGVTNPPCVLHFSTDVARLLFYWKKKNSHYYFRAETKGFAVYVFGDFVIWRRSSMVGGRV